MKVISKPGFLEGYDEIIAASILWGFVGILIRKIEGISAISIIFYRMVFASLILFAVLSLSGNLHKIKLKDKKFYLLLFSGFQVTTMLSYFVSILEASVSTAVLLLYTAPVYVTLLSPVILKERYSEKGLLALVLAIAGIFLIVDTGKLEFTRSTGIIAGMISGLSYAFQIMTSKHIGFTYSGYSQAFWSFIAAIPVIIIVDLIARAGIMTVLPDWLAAIFALLRVDIALSDVVSMNAVYLILLAIFPTILSVSLYFNGLKKVRASHASILGLIEPLSAVILSVIILHETLSYAIILGGALILIGAAIVTTES